MEGSTQEHWQHRVPKRAAAELKKEEQARPKKCKKLSDVSSESSTSRFFSDSSLFSGGDCNPSIRASSRQKKRDICGGGDSKSYREPPNRSPSRHQRDSYGSGSEDHRELPTRSSSRHQHDSCGSDSEGHRELSTETSSRRRRGRGGSRQQNDAPLLGKQGTLE
ncbi:unnamed protein product, partial [Laminaria digitata]